MAASRRDGGEPARRQQEGIAAGDDDLPDRRPGADIVERRFELGRGQALALRPDLLAAEAEAAIDRADMGGLQQHPVGIAVDDALEGREAPIADRVEIFLRSGFHLARIGDELAGDGVAVVAALDQLGHVRRDRHGKALGHGGDISLALGRDQPGGDQLGGTAQRAGPRPLTLPLLRQAQERVPPSPRRGEGLRGR